MVSFCLICAIRYSRLLIQGEKSDDGAGEGTRDGEGEPERVEETEGDEQREYIARKEEKWNMSKRCDAKTHHWTEETFYSKGNPHILPYFAVITESCPPSKKNTDKCRTG
jgi:hypothetical protein